MLMKHFSFGPKLCSNGSNTVPKILIVKFEFHRGAFSADLYCKNVQFFTITVSSEPHETHSARTAHEDGREGHARTPTTVRDWLQHVVFTKHRLRVGDKQMESNSAGERCVSKFGVQVQNQGRTLLQEFLGERSVRQFPA